MAGSSPEADSWVMTVGHSTRKLEDFIGLLKRYGATMLVDVRTVPRSRHNPQFNRETLPNALTAAGIRYMHMTGLGGLRHSRLQDSPNTGWQNLSFRNYADYMQTKIFEENLEELMALARQETLSIMCAETLPWRCHRSLIADALKIRGFRVRHIVSEKNSLEHTLTPFARVEGSTIIYPRVSAPEGSMEDA